MLQNHSNKLDLLWTTQWLCQHVSHIVIQIHMTSLPFITSYTFTNKVIGYSIQLLLQCLTRDFSIKENRLVVSKDKSWLINLDSHHSQLVPQATDILLGFYSRFVVVPARA